MDRLGTEHGSEKPEHNRCDTPAAAWSFETIPQHRPADSGDDRKGHEAADEMGRRAAPLGLEEVVVDDMDGSDSSAERDERGSELETANEWHARRCAGALTQR